MKTEERAHADAGPSSSENWIKCPAYVTLGRGMKQSSTYAREGSAAHKVAELQIEGEPLPAEITVEGETFEVTEEMIEHTADYVNFAEIMRETADLFGIEQRVSLEDYFPNGMPEPVFGTTDMYAYELALRLLTIADFKYGKGKTVSAVDNPQLMIYALMVIAMLVRLGHPEPREIRMMIFQPRGMGAKIKTHTISHAELMTFAVEKLFPAIERIGRGDTTEVPGSCTFCPRLKGDCKAVTNMGLAQAQTAFAAAGKPAGLTDDELADILTKAKILEPWIKAAREEAMRRIESGHTIRGWAITPTQARRKWVDEIAAAAVLSAHGVKSTDLYETELKSPSKMEAILKKTGAAKEGIALLFKELVVKESKGVTLTEVDPEDQPDLALAFSPNSSVSSADDVL